MNAMTSPSHISMVSTQWAHRPREQRYVNLDHMLAQAITDHTNSRAKNISTRRFELQPYGDDHKGLQIVGQNGAPAFLTNYAFGQLCALGGAPVGFLRELPSELAADALNYGLRFIRDAEDVKVLLTAIANVGEPDQTVELRAATGPNYGRIWNKDIIDAVVKHFGNGTREGGGRFQVPGEFRVQVPITTGNTTFYYGDRSMMIFLADETNLIEIPNRRGGVHGNMARGIIIWNSEVGDSTMGMAAFTYDYTCQNRNIWGVGEYKEVRLRHTVSAPDKWVEQIAPVIEAYANSSTAEITQTIVAAQAAKIDTDLDTFLKNRKFTKPEATAIKAAHMREEGRPIETLWDLSTGITAHAKTITWQDDRMGMERRAGAILDLVAA